MYRRTLLASAGALAVAGRVGRAKAATPGVTATEIRIGNTCPYSGPASAYAAQGLSEAAYFRMVNDQGGIGGRKINFISRDDAINPAKTLEQTRRLVEEEGVALMFSGIGTAAQLAVRKYLNDRQVPQLFVSAGTDSFADPQHYPWTMGFIPSYRTEAAIYARHLLREKPDARLGVLYQNDDFGKDYLLGLKDGLGDRYANVVVAEVSYEVTDATIDSQAFSLQSAGADAVLTAATPKFAAQMIRRLAAMNWKPLHFISYVSASVGAVITPAGPQNAVGLLSAISYKDPSDPAWSNDPALADWRGFMKHYLPDADVANMLYMSGHGFGATVIQVLRQCGDDLSRANIMRQAANLHDFEIPLLLPGIRVNTSPTNFRPIRSMQMTRFDGTSWRLFGDIISS